MTPDAVSFFEFDHLGLQVKVERIAHLISIGTSIKTIDEEIEKCQLVCADCHMIRTNLRRQEVQISRQIVMAVRQQDQEVFHRFIEDVKRPDHQIHVFIAMAKDVQESIRSRKRRLKSKVTARKERMRQKRITENALAEPVADPVWESKDGAVIEQLDMTNQVLIRTYQSYEHAASATSIPVEHLKDATKRHGIAAPYKWRRTEKDLPGEAWKEGTTVLINYLKTLGVTETSADRLKLSNRGRRISPKLGKIPAKYIDGDYYFQFPRLASSSRDREVHVRAKLLLDALFTGADGGWSVTSPVQELEQRV